MTLQSGFTFQLWDEMRAHAQRSAESAAPVPSVAECVLWLRSAMQRHRVELPESVVNFYAEELRSMIEELRAKQTRSE